MSTIFSSSTQFRCSEADLEHFLALPRNTPSVTHLLRKAAGYNAESKSGGDILRGVLTRLDKRRQHAVRTLAYERMVLEAKMSSVLERIESWGEGDVQDMAGESGVDVLQRLQTAAEDSDYNLKHCVGAATAREVLSAVWAEDMQQFLRLSVMSEDEARALQASTWDEAGVGEGGGLGDSASCAGRSVRSSRTAGGGMKSPSATRGTRGDSEASERAARLWRRRLFKITIPVRIDAKLHWGTAHDDYDRNGRRSLVNDLNRRNTEDGLSYYQKQSLKYGPSRERRGSTGTAGRLQALLASSAATQSTDDLEAQLEAELYGEGV